MASNKIYEVGTKAIYISTITNVKTDCVVSIETLKTSNIIPVNLLDKDGKVTYKDAWVSKDNLTFI